MARHGGSISFSGVARGGGKPWMTPFGVTPYYDVIPREPCFFILFGLQPHLHKKLSNFRAKTFFNFYLLIFFMDFPSFWTENPLLLR